MNTLAHSGIFWVGLIAGLVRSTSCPHDRDHPEGREPGLLIFLNVLPTGVGWFAAMVMAFMLPRREPPLTYTPASTLPVSAGAVRHLLPASSFASAV